MFFCFFTLYIPHRVPCCLFSSVSHLLLENRFISYLSFLSYLQPHWGRFPNSVSFFFLGSCGSYFCLSSFLPFESKCCLVRWSVTPPFFPLAGFPRTPIFFFPSLWDVLFSFSFVSFCPFCSSEGPSLWCLVTSQSSMSLARIFCFCRSTVRFVLFVPPFFFFSYP